MISHYFKLARKSLIKNKYYTLINVFGLVCGMLSALIIGKYIGGSLQFDSFHQKKERIFFLTQNESIDGNPQNNKDATYWGVGELLDQFPEVVNFTRYDRHVESLIIAEGEKDKRVSFMEGRIFVTDSSFLNIFTFPLIHGNPKTALSRVNSVVLTNSASRKYFGDANPIGKSITIRVSWGHETQYEVTGVMKDIPKRSRFGFDFLITPPRPLTTGEFWNFPACSIYMLLKENVSDTGLAEKLTAALAQVPQLLSTNRKLRMNLQSIADIQLSDTEYLLAAVSIFIILICWVNYLNQIIAQSYLRMKETGILRVMGATRANLRTQFIVESGLVCLASLILVIGIYISFENSLQSMTNGHLLPLFGDPTAINLMFVVIFMVGIALAATVPTVILFSPDFGATLRNIYSTKIGGVGLRKALVVIQFSISTILVISIFVITNQLEYVSTKDKGFAMKDILIVRAPHAKDTTWNVRRKTLELFKERCAALPFVTGIASSTTVPGEEYRHETYLSLGSSNDKSLVHQAGVDENFFGLYEVEFIAGHDFIPDARAKNRSSIILNESAARALGISDLDKVINTTIVDHEEEPHQLYDLIGIVKDFHQTSLKYEMRPMAFKYNVLRGHSSLKINRDLLNDTHLAEGLAALKKISEETYPDVSFDYFFLDEKYEAGNMEDRSFGKLFEYFTVLSIIISCLGLLGLSLLISTKRQKEIGVRKVFGASSTNILGIFLKGYLGPLCLSVVIGSPPAYFLMDMWLRNYAYRIEIGFGLVASALLSLATIFVCTVSYHTIKTSMAKPVEILRD